MCIPPQSITTELAAAAIERLLGTEDPDDRVHRLEHVIKCMPRSEAEEWQRRLASLSDEARLADRRVLLGLEPDADELAQPTPDTMLH
jgi:hypothetical protein